MLLYTNNELVQIYRVFTMDFDNTSAVFGQKRPDGAPDADRHVVQLYLGSHEECQEYLRELALKLRDCNQALIDPESI